MAVNVKIDRRLLVRDLQPRRTIMPILQERIYRIFLVAKTEMLQNLLKHPISNEIEGGPLAPSISGCLNWGNLFSFIGFDEGDSPVNKLYNYLDNSIQLTKTPIERLTENMRYTFSIQRPTQKDFIANFPLPWAAGRSWVLSIEKGISNFGYYMFLKKRAAKSHSGFGLQAKKKINIATFKPKPYISEIFDKFESRLSNIGSFVSL